VGRVDEGAVRFNRLYEWSAKENAMLPTGIPSRFRTKVCKLAGLDVQSFEVQLQRRAKLLTAMGARGLAPEAFMDAVEGV
jgi:hypothetical protein